MIAHLPDRRLELFFPVVIMIAHPPDRRLELFFPVVIAIAHPPDRQLELFFPVVIMITHLPDRQLYLFFLVVIMIPHPPHSPVVITIMQPPDRLLYKPIAKDIVDCVTHELTLQDVENDPNWITKSTWLCQFLVLVGNWFWFYILLMYLGYRTIQLWFCVSFFGFGGK